MSVNTQNILGSLSGLSTLGSGILGNQNLANYNNNLANYAGNTPLQAWNVNNNGVGASMAGNTFNTNLGPGLSAAGSGLQSLAALGTNSALGYMNGGLPSNILGGIGTYNNNFGAANSGLLSISNPTGLNQLIGSAQGGANNLIGTAGADFNSVYNQQYGSLLQQLQLPQQLQMNANRNNQFGMGTLGTTGGALQTSAMATGFGQADLAAAQQAYQQALTTQNSATQNAGILGTLASNQQLTGMNLYNNLNNLGLNNLNTQGQISTMPSALSGATLNNLVNPALTGNSNLNQLGLSNAQLALQGGTALSNSNAMAANALKNNQYAGTTGASNLLGALGGNNGLLSALGGGNGSGSLSSLLGGGSNGGSGLFGSLGNLFGGGGTSAASLGIDTTSNYGAITNGLLDNGGGLATDLGDLSSFSSAGGQAAALGGDMSGLTSVAGGDLSALGMPASLGMSAGDSAAVSAAGGLGSTLSSAVPVVGALAGGYSTYNNIESGNALGAGISGAETGAAIGSIVPGIGTAIGAIAGGLIGAGGALIKGKHTQDTITNPNEGTTIKLQSGNSALENSGVAYGAGSSRGQGSGQWFLDPAASGTLTKTTGSNAGGLSGGAGQPSVTAGNPFYIGSQASGILTNFANSVPLKGGQPDFSSYLAQYQKNPDSNTGLIGVYNNNGGQAAWGSSFSQWLQGIWSDKNGVTGNLTT